MGISSLLIACSPPTGFEREHSAISDKIDCTKTFLDPGDGNGSSLWGCTGGSQLSVKVFVNETDFGHEVRDIKFLWRDENRNLGYGLHIDKETANKWLLVIADIYAPDKWSEVFDAFHSKEGMIIKSNTHTLSYSFQPSANDDARMLIISKNNTVQSEP